MLLAFEFFLVILETPSCLLLLALTLRLLDMFRVLNVCAKTSVFLGKPLRTSLKIFCSNLWQFHSVSTDLFLFQALGFYPTISFVSLFHVTSFLFCWSSDLFLCNYAVFEFYLCFCAGFKIGTCAFKPSRP